MIPFTRADINTTVKVVQPLSQQDANIYNIAPNLYVGQIGTVTQVDDYLKLTKAQLICLRLGVHGRVWLSADALERGTLVQTWKPDVTPEEIPENRTCPGCGTRIPCTWEGSR